jgi:hypothetical protein
MISYLLREWGDSDSTDLDRPGGGRPYVSTMEITEARDGDLWAYASKVARTVSGKCAMTLDILMEDDMAWHARDLQQYIVTYCGGFPHWCPAGGYLHQTGQARFGKPSFCWSCFNGEYNHGRPGDVPRGTLVHHPDTPAELGSSSSVIIPGRLQLTDACTACAGGWSFIEHNSTRPGEGYLDGTRLGEGYAEHGPYCWKLGRSLPYSMA